MLWYSHCAYSCSATFLQFDVLWKQTLTVEQNGTDVGAFLGVKCN